MFSWFANSVVSETAFSVLVRAQKLEPAGKDVIRLEIADNLVASNSQRCWLNGSSIVAIGKKLARPKDINGINALACFEGLRVVGNLQSVLRVVLRNHSL